MEREEEMSMVSTTASTVTRSETPANRHKSKVKCSVTRKGFLLGVGFLVVISILVGILCRQERSIGGDSVRGTNSKSSANIAEPRLQALEAQAELIAELKSRIEEHEVKHHETQETIAALQNEVIDIHVTLLKI